MKHKFSIVIAMLVLASCAEKEAVPKEWTVQKTIALDGINPIGITSINDTLWLSDGDHNRLVQINDAGKILKTIDALERPMHIDSEDEALFIPQYGNDVVLQQSMSGQIASIYDASKDSLEAPASVSAFDGELAIADFYNNRILYKKEDSWISFGKEGKAHGDFYYPTDVQITKDKIWVADAYNNRVQVFDKEGSFLQVLGEDQKMNAATGIYVSEMEVFVSDFENDRVLVFDHRGMLKQELKAEVDKPIDMIIFNDQLHILNYRKGIGDNFWNPSYDPILFKGIVLQGVIIWSYKIFRSIMAIGYGKIFTIFVFFLGYGIVIGWFCKYNENTPIATLQYPLLSYSINFINMFHTYKGVVHYIDTKNTIKHD